jgi:PAS domain S-box-containing protein
MIDKPTYEELEQRVKDLEQEKRQLLERRTEIEPEMIPEDLDLKSIIDVDEIQSILDDFHYLTNMVTAILDLNGEVIEATGWQDICTKFHRMNPETAINCKDSDLYLSKNLKPGEYVDYQCKNGLWDVVTPLFVGTKHLGNIFTGQFFYDDHEVNENSFIKQAEKYGFDKALYLDAFRRIPRYDKETINHLMSFLVKFTTYISKIGLANIQLGREIKNRKESEEALRKSEKEYRSTLNNLLVGVVLHARDTSVLLCNPAAENILGLTYEQMLGKKAIDPSWSFVHEDSTIMKIEDYPVNRVLATQKSLSNSVVGINTPDKDHVTWIIVNAIPVFADPRFPQKAELEKIIVNFIDITSQKLAEESLRKSEALFRTITEQSGEGLCLIDTDGYFIIANPALGQMTGYNKTELSGIHIKDVVAPGTEIRLFPNVMNGQSGTREIELIRKDGTSFLADIRGYPIKLENQNGMLGIIRDITDIKIREQKKKNLEIRVQQSHKMEALGTLAGGIAHDFNNILSSILGFTELAKFNLNEDEEAKSNLDEAISAGLRARDLVKHILTFSRKSDAQKNIIQIVPLIKECIRFLKASVPPNIDIRHHFTKTDMTVLSDPTQLHQILMNLFTNAAYAMKENGGTLEVKLDSINIGQAEIFPTKEIIPGKYVQLIISDTGCGIPKYLIGKIFEPFFTTKGRMEGTGMGLSMVYGIIKEMKGEITVESEEGLGSTFEILIPEQIGEPQNSIDDDVKLTTGKGRILLVDDEAAIVKWCSQVLVRLGYRVAGFMNSMEALEKFKQDSNGFDLILTDLAMPQITGLELVKQIKKIRSDIPVILCTGFP